MPLDGRRVAQEPIDGDLAIIRRREALGAALHFYKRPPEGEVSIAIGNPLKAGNSRPDDDRTPAREAHLCHRVSEVPANYFGQSLIPCGQLFRQLRIKVCTLPPERFSEASLPIDTRFAFKQPLSHRVA